MTKQITQLIATITVFTLVFSNLGTIKSFACGTGWFETPCSETTQKNEALFTEKNQQKLIQAVPNPELQDSIERRNLKERLQRNNKADKIGYVFLLSDTGSVIANYTIKGKVSSLNSLLTTPDQVVKGGGEQCNSSLSSSASCFIVTSPDLDGSYGKNPEGVFFFTSDGNMIEWTGKYLYSEQPMTLSTAPVLTYKVN
jgi:hypothetical protein